MYNKKNFKLTKNNLTNFCFHVLLHLVVQCFLHMMYVTCKLQFDSYVIHAETHQVLTESPQLVVSMLQFLYQSFFASYQEHL